METPIDHTSKADLFQVWLQAMGVDYPSQLDLGTLSAIAEFVASGHGPSNPDAIASGVTVGFKNRA